MPCVRSTYVPLRFDVNVGSEGKTETNANAGSDGKDETSNEIPKANWPDDPLWIRDYTGKRLEQLNTIFRFSQTRSPQNS